MGKVTSNHQRALVDVRILVLRRHEVLLIQLVNSLFHGSWNLPGGHAMTGEDVVSAAVRELQEEVGLRVQPDNLHFCSVTHHRPPSRSEKVTFTFTVRCFVGEPHVAEPDRASTARWTSLDALPSNLMLQAAASLRLFQRRQRFETFGLLADRCHDQ